MGIETGTAMLIGSALTAVGTAATLAMTPSSPMNDATDYELLKATQEQANAESDAAKARIEEERKREQLRQQAAQASGVLTTDTGANSLSVANQVLGAPFNDKEI